MTNKPLETTTEQVKAENTFTCVSCHCKFDKNHALAFRVKINAKHPDTKNISDEGEVCGKKCLMDALNAAADQVYGIRSGAIHPNTQRQHIKGGHHIETRKTSH